MKTVLMAVALLTLAACGGNSNNESSLQNGSIHSEHASYCGTATHRYFDLGAPTEFVVLTYKEAGATFDVALSGGVDDSLKAQLVNLELPLGGNNILCVEADTAPRDWAYGKILTITNLSIVPWMPSTK